MCPWTFWCTLPVLHYRHWIGDSLKASEMLPAFKAGDNWSESWQKDRNEPWVSWKLQWCRHLNIIIFRWTEYSSCMLVNLTCRSQNKFICNMQISFLLSFSCLFFFFLQKSWHTKKICLMSTQATKFLARVRSDARLLVRAIANVEGLFSPMPDC